MLPLWIIGLATAISAVSGYNFLKVKYIIGHDAYFHYYISNLILKNGLHLPVIVTNYWEGVKYGYPPLLHISAAIVSSLTSFDLVDVYRLFPVIALGLLVWLVYRYLQTEAPRYAFSATVIFVLIGFSIVAIYQGEYARVLGLVFSLMTLTQLNWYLDHKRMLNLALAVLFLTLAITSNLVTALFMVAFLSYLQIWHYHRDRSLIVLKILLAGLVLSGFWWARGVYFYGVDYFINVLLSHNKTFYSLVVGSLATILTAIYAWRAKKLPSTFWMWTILSVFLVTVEYASIPIAFYTGRLVFNRLNGWPRKSWVAFHLALSILAVTVFANLTSGRTVYHDSFVNPDVIAAGEWVRLNTDPDVSIMAYLEASFVPSDTFSTWSFMRVSLNTRDVSLPALTDRQVYTWMGYEWDTHPEQIQIYHEFQQRLCADHLIATARKYSISPDLIWVNKDTKQYQEKIDFCDDLDRPVFTPIYENDRVLIYEVDWDSVATNR